MIKHADVAAVCDRHARVERCPGVRAFGRLGFTEAETGYTEYWSDSGWATVDVTPDTVGVRFYSMEREALYEYAIE